MKKEVIEGKLTLTIDTADVVSKDLEVFYNPKMALNRALSCSVIRASEKKDMRIALPLAGTGIRALRFLEELDSNQIQTIWVNDKNPESQNYFLHNAKQNNLDSPVKEKIELVQEDANVFLQTSEGFDYIDIDPYGSPNFLLDSAVSRLKEGAILAVTATDTAALSGTYPSVCKRKYWARSARCSQQHEMGLRILIRKVQLIGLHCERALTPILSYHDEHYYRIFFVSTKSKSKATALFTQVEESFLFCPSCGFHTTHQAIHQTCPHCKKDMQHCGPLFTGSLQDHAWLEKCIASTSAEEKEALRVLQLIKRDSAVDEEFGIAKSKEDKTNKVQSVVGSYDTHQLCKLHKLRVEPLEKTITKIVDKGYVATRSCFPLTGIKTTAPFEEILHCLKN